MSRSVRITGFVAILFYVQLLVSPAYAQVQTSWGSVKALYGQSESVTINGSDKANTFVPNPFPFEIIIQGDLDLYTAQLTVCRIGLPEFDGKEVVAVRDAEFPDDIVVIASDDDQADLYWFGNQTGVENHAILTLNSDGSIHYVDDLGQIYDIPADLDPDSKFLGITKCELGMGLAGVAQCTLIGLAGPWFAAACGVKWVVLGAMTCN